MFKYILMAIALLTVSCSGRVKEEKPATTAEPAKAASKFVQVYATRFGKAIVPGKNAVMVVEQEIYPADSGIQPT